MQHFHVGHDHFIFVDVDFICVGSHFLVELGFRLSVADRIFTIQVLFDWRIYRSVECVWHIKVGQHIESHVASKSECQKG